MSVREVDVAIIGAGTAGLNAFRETEKQGKSAVLIDRGPLGTTCARVGCMPSKLLIAPAKFAHDARTASGLGINATIEVDGAQVMARMQSLRDRFVGGVLKSTSKKEEEGHLIKGSARFIDTETLDVDGQKVKADSFVLAVGSRPVIPGPYQQLGDALLTNENVFEMQDLPDSMLVVGAGVIGLELGQAFHRLGVRTTIVSLDGLLAALNDPKMVESGTEILREELDLHTDHQLHSVELDSDGMVEIDFTDSTGERRKERFEKVLVATGRKPNLDSLNLNVFGVELNAKGSVDVDEHTLQIGNTPLFVAGDSNAERPLLHEASDEGRIAGKNACTFPATRAFQRRTPLTIIFTHPNIAVVGKTVDQHNCVHHRVGEINYENQGRARVEGKNRGLVRIYGEAHSGRITGAEMMGPGVEHTAHLLAWAIQSQMTVEEALDMPVYHPVVEEGIRTALRNLRSAIDRPLRAELCDEFSPGG